MPAGPFARRLAQEIARTQGKAMRLILNGGDLVDWRGGEALRPAPNEAFGSWLERALVRRRITDVVTLGDVNVYAAQALDAARRLGLRRHIIEQGYLRPDWITLEAEGVNARSSLPRDPAFYLALPPARATAPQGVGVIAPYQARNIVVHYGAMLLMKPLFPHHVYPHSAGIVRQGFGHVMRFARTAIARAARVTTRLSPREQEGRFFVLFLQREGDSQLCVHSDLPANADVLDHVLASFARDAPPGDRLVVKNHPWDPALTDLARLTRQTAARYGLQGRVSFLDGGSFSPLARRALGVVAVNSTAALSAIGLGVPTKLLGRAFFDIEGLADQRPLQTFWRAPVPPDPALYARFRRHVLETTQVYGNFHNPRHMAGTAERLVQRFLAT